jgi:phosphate:Na+ symporter
MSATINIESLADVIESELSDICKVYIDQDLQESEETLSLLGEFTNMVSQAFDKLIAAIKNDDEAAAAEVIALKEQIQHSVDNILKNQASRINVQTSKHLLLVRLELELLDNLRRIYTLTKRVAKEFIPDELAIKTD